MNIFFLDPDPLNCAAMHCDKHVIKMATETLQLLNTARRVTAGEVKVAWAQHPCAVWTRASRPHFLWLARLGIFLCAEYTRRYGRLHACLPAIVEHGLAPPDLPDRGWSDPPQVMPLKYRGEDCVAAYRNYYFGEKSRFATWKTAPPQWWPQRSSA